MVPVSRSDVDAFARDGAIFVADLVDGTTVDHLRAAVDANLADPSASGSSYTSGEDAGGFRDDYCNWERFDAYRDLVFHSDLAEVVGRLLETMTVRFHHEHVLVKEPGTAERSPWHHDQPYYNVDGDQVASVWLALDPVDRAVAPEFVLGSHRGPFYLPRHFFDHRSYPTYGTSYEPVPDVEAQRDELHIASWSLEPGDAVIFHMRTLHSAPGTENWPHRRRAIATRWIGDDAVFARRPGPTSPPMDWLDLEPGQPLDHPRVPLVWQAITLG